MPHAVVLDEEHAAAVAGETRADVLVRLPQRSPVDGRDADDVAPAEQAVTPRRIVEREAHAAHLGICGRTAATGRSSTSRTPNATITIAITNASCRGMPRSRRWVPSLRARRTLMATIDP